jgi:UDP-N-acetylmuramate dehydrogenase
MFIATDVSLRSYHTFGLDVRTAALAQFNTEADLRELLNLDWTSRMVLGGGSNVLFAEDYDGLVLVNRIEGISIEEESGTTVTISAGAGVNWHGLVLWSLERGLSGLENLSLIPGTCGAAPIQNIGAYGVELSDVFVSLDGIDLTTGQKRRFTAKDCRFGYRYSIFKDQLKGQFAITRITLRLERGTNRLSLEYGAIREELDAMEIRNPTAADVSRAVVRIRQSKLPDPEVLGNAGSFFKNPEVSAMRAAELREEFPKMPFWPMAEGRVKTSAGWLIEQCGWKGRRVGHVGCYARQALVLVNYGEATGAELWEHAQRVAESVASRFGIQLIPEVNVVGQPRL